MVTKLIYGSKPGQKGDSLIDIVEQNLGIVYSVCFRDMQDPKLVDDAVQSAFLIYKSNTPRRSPEKYKAQRLYRIARTVSGKICRQSGKIKQTHQAGASRKWEAIETCLHFAMDQLKPLELELFLQHYFYGYEIRDLVTLYNVSDHTASRSLDHALRKVHRILSRTDSDLTLSGLAALLRENALIAPSYSCENSLKQSIGGQGWWSQTASHLAESMLRGYRVRGMVTVLAIIAVAALVGAAFQKYRMTNTADSYAGEGGVLLRYSFHSGEKSVYQFHSHTVIDNSGQKIVTDLQGKIRDITIKVKQPKGTAHIITETVTPNGKLIGDKQLSMISPNGESKFNEDDLLCIAAQCKYHLPDPYVKPGYTWGVSINGAINSTSSYRFVEKRSINGSDIAVIDLVRNVKWSSFERNLNGETGHYTVYFDIDHGKVVKSIQHIQRKLSRNVTEDTDNTIELTSA